MQYKNHVMRLLTAVLSNCYSAQVLHFVRKKVFQELVAKLIETIEPKNIDISLHLQSGPEVIMPSEFVDGYYTPNCHNFAVPRHVFCLITVLPLKFKRYIVTSSLTLEIDFPRE